MVDSDAVVSLDPFDVIQWFCQHGDKIVSHPTTWSRLFSRHESLIVRTAEQALQPPR